MIGIIDFGMGNLKSVYRAVEAAGGKPVIVSDAAGMERCSRLVLPGVGAFEDAIGELYARGLVDPLLAAIGDGVPVLGVCLGMQLLMTVSYENGRHPGLGVIPGKVTQFRLNGVARVDYKVPHMGWNRIHVDAQCPLLNNIPDGSHMYFVHSYYCQLLDDAHELTHTDYGHRFTSSLWRDNVFGVQYHPEKSQAVGLQMYRNFLNL